MSDAHWYRFLCHVAAVLSAMLVWAFPIDFSEALLGSIVVFFIIHIFADRRYGAIPGPADIKRDIEERFGRHLDPPNDPT